MRFASGDLAAGTTSSSLLRSACMSSGSIEKRLPPWPGLPTTTANNVSLRNAPPLVERPLRCYLQVDRCSITIARSTAFACHKSHQRRDVRRTFTTDNAPVYQLLAKDAFAGEAPPADHGDAFVTYLVEPHLRKSVLSDFAWCFFCNLARNPVAPWVVSTPGRAALLGEPPHTCGGIDSPALHLGEWCRPRNLLRVRVLLPEQHGFAR